MLSEKSLLFFLDGLLFEGLDLGSFASFFVFGFALLSVHLELLLPQLFDISLMLLFAHSSLLSIHLLKSFIFGKLLSHLHLEFFFHLAFFF